MRNVLLLLGCWVVACEGAVESTSRQDAAVTPADRTHANDDETTITHGASNDPSDTHTSDDDSDLTNPPTSGRPGGNTANNGKPTSDTSRDESDASNDVSADPPPADEQTSAAASDTTVVAADDASNSASDSVVDEVNGTGNDESGGAMDDTVETVDTTHASDTNGVDTQDTAQGDESDNQNEQSDDTDAPDPTTVAPAIRTSKLGNELSSNGLLPFAATLGQADNVAHVPLMRGFEQSLGSCSDCHAADYARWTPQKYVSLHMWEDIVTKVKFKDGGVLFCDSCHQGQAKFLNRSDPAALERWMQVNLVDRLERVDGKPHGCETCHGDPPNYELLAAWSRAN